MAKSDKGDLYKQTQEKIGQSETEYNALNEKIGGRGDVTWDRATENYNPAFEGYKDYASGGGLKPEDIDRMRGAWGNVGGGSGGGGGGGWSAPRLGPSAYQNLSSAFGSAYRPDYGESDTGFRRLADKGGGFDAAQLEQIYGNIGNLSEIGRTGGITDEDKANILRKQMLEQEQTGGYSEQDKALVRAKSAASSPAYFSALKDNLERQRSQTGNLANAGAVDFKLARQSAQQQAGDRLAQEMELQESVRGGKERAGQFLSGQGLELAGLRTRNQLAGAESGARTGTETQAAITANQQRALQGLQESQTGLGQWGLGQAGGLDQFALGRAGGLDQMTMMQAQLEAQAAASSAASGAASNYASSRDKAEFEQWLTEYGNQQKQYGIGGLESLYKTNLGASENFTGMGLDALNSKYGTQGQLLGLASQNRGATGMENAMQIAGAAGGILGGLTGIGGGPGGGGGGKPSTPSNTPGYPISGVGTGPSFGGDRLTRPGFGGSGGAPVPPEDYGFGGDRGAPQMRYNPATGRWEYY